MYGATSISINSAPLSLSGSVKLRYEKCLEVWGNAKDIRKKLLTNVWCAACHHEVTITNFTGVINSGDLLLVGKCAECHCDVARVVKGA